MAQSRPKARPAPRAPSPNATVPRQFRLAEETLAKLDAIAAHFDLGSRAAAIRYAATVASVGLPPAPKKNPRGRRKTT